jgi:ATP-dependent protease ClpP protease subunit
MSAKRDRQGRITELRAPSGRVAWSRSAQSPAPRRIRTAAGADTHTMWLYDEIGDYGITAGAFVQELAGVTASNVDLRICSPGGDAYQGVAMFEAVARHPARVVAHVDGLAASAASFIAMAADEVLIGGHAEMMVHDAHALCVGAEADMIAMAADLGRVSDNIASIYAGQAGGDVKGWRKVMRGERWYTAAEAVDVGLADGIDGASEDQSESDVDGQLAAALSGLSLAASIRAGIRAAAPPDPLEQAFAARWTPAMATSVAASIRDAVNETADTERSHRW